ncbi:thiamine pyrophosphate-dependent enzyme, partial [Pauljensenia sp. UMB3104]|nr:thiamine pyrophosphate-dependent enzyme [Pauljensenia sp. UMB3104]
VYRSPEELEEVKANDPIKKFKAQLIEEGYLTEAENEKIYQELQAEVDQATDEAEASPDPTPESLYEQVYAD